MRDRTPVIIAIAQYCYQYPKSNYALPCRLPLSEIGESEAIAVAHSSNGLRLAKNLAQDHKGLIAEIMRTQLNAMCESGNEKVFVIPEDESDGFSYALDALLVEEAKQKRTPRLYFYLYNRYGGHWYSYHYSTKQLHQFTC